MGKRFGRSFYTQATLTVGRKLLGARLISRVDDQLKEGIIIETECYIGPHDRASHAYGGKKTQRNEAEFRIGGHVYIYLVYGMYWQFNVSTFQADTPECVLIRALYPLNGYQTSLSEKQKMRLANGPGKLCRWKGFNKQIYGEDLASSSIVWIENGERITPRDIRATRRINIDYAGAEWSSKPWRFLLKRYAQFLP